MWEGPKGDGAGVLFILIFIAVCGFAALLCWALAIRSGGSDA